MAKRGSLRIVLVTLFVLCQATWTLAGTTGNITGTVRDQSGAPIAGARITIASPSQTQTVTTGTKGFYSALNLSPDTYTVTASKDGYDSATTYGITVQADQTSRADVTLRATTKIIGRIVTTATASVVSRTVTGDLYAVNSQAIQSYQGSQGGAETLYSQGGAVASLPGVVRNPGSGAGYAQQGNLSLRGGAQDQVGYELEGVPLNRGFDFYNSTSFVTNGLAGLEVYTGGAPASEGRAMSGYINEVIQRGKYPGGADFTGVVGSPVFNHTIQADVYGGTPDNRFTYYVSTLAINMDNAFGPGGGLEGLSLTIPSGDPGCAAAVAANGGFGASSCNAAGLMAANTVARIPVSIGPFFNLLNTSERDTVTNLHWNLTHNGLNDDLQALYVVGNTEEGNFYSGQGIDPVVGALFSNASNQIIWPTGTFYTQPVGGAYNPGNNATLTWPSSGGSQGGPVPDWYIDGQTTPYGIEKLSYTRSLSQSAFLRLYAYTLYSALLIDSATQGNNNGVFYQLHDNATGYTMNLQDQLNDRNLLKIDADYTRDLTLRYNYVNYAAQQRLSGEVRGRVLCGTIAAGPAGLAACNPGDTVAQIRGPYAYWSTTTPLNFDGVLSDQWKPSDRLLFDFGVRYDRFGYVLMPLQINGANGIAEQAQNQFGICLAGYGYAAGEPCNGYLTALATADNRPDFLPGATTWQDAAGTLWFNAISPRFGVTFTLNPQNVLRASVGRYVQPPNSTFEEYRAAPQWGAGDTVSVLNRFYSAPGLNFHAVHNILPEDSTNYDLSFEHDFGNGVSAKVTPYYRNTRNQVLNLPVDPANPTFSTGLNVGTARIKGAEFLLHTNRQHENGLSAAISATYTDSKVRFLKNASGLSYIDIVNGVDASGRCITTAAVGICGYNRVHGTNYPLEDPQGYYSPSFLVAPTAANLPSYDVRWVLNINLDERMNGFDITPTFNYQSGNPYGDPLMFPDPTGLAANGPDPYTHNFDALGALKGAAWWTMNLGIAHDLGNNIKGSVLWTNVFTTVQNHGYPWEYPASSQVISYADNPFYIEEPLGAARYAGVNYYPYAPTGVMPTREFIFSVTTRL